MKALSVKPPWSGLIACGVKTIETRTWRTEYRGDLLICSSKSIDRNVPPSLFVSDECFKRGVAICIVNVVTCVPMTDGHVKEACCQVYDGAWAWILEDIRIVKNVPVKGGLSIFNVPFEPKDLLL